MLKEKFVDLKDKIFFKNDEIDDDEKKFYQIKASKIRIENEMSIMIKIIDITSEILLDKQKSHNKLLSVINSTVSHEVRNPLNSIVAINEEKKNLYGNLAKIFERDSLEDKDKIK